MNTKERIANEERLISHEREVLDNLRDFRLSEEPGMYAGEINCEIDRLEKDVRKHLKLLGRLQAVA